MQPRNWRKISNGEVDEGAPGESEANLLDKS